MKRKSTLTFITILVILSFLASPVAAAPVLQDEPPETERGQATGLVASTGVNPNQAGITSLTGSNVTFTTDGPGDDMYIPGVEGTFYFVAESFSPDWEYVYNVWLRFPTDWTVTNVAVIGTPACDMGGTWGTFGWSFETSPYEVNISHPRYQANNPAERCEATYAVTAIPGAPTLFADISWYWDGDGYAGAPHHPCSAPGYTPPSMVEPCDEATNPVAQIPTASMDPGVYLFPEVQDGGGCNGEPLNYDVSLYNNTGTNGTFALTYDILDGLGTLTGPATIDVLDDEIGEFQVVFTPDVCAIPDGEVIGEVSAEGNTFVDTAVIFHHVTSGGGWEQVVNSAPSWAGNGYLSDGCTAFNAAGDAVTYIIGDVSGTGPVGFWGYNHDTNTWSQPAAANTPADRWAPDWAYDEVENECYLTGGASAPGAGTYNDAYVYDPVANAFTALPNFTSIRDFHDSWIGTVDGTEYLCIGGGNNGAGLTSTQCMDLATNVWAAENATIGAMPTDTWGAADGVLHDAGGDIFMSVAGAQTGSLISDAVWYWDDADNMWHSGGNTGQPIYRVEGDIWDGEFYQVAGSNGSFTGTTAVRKGTWDGTAWTWTAFQDLANRKMDNVVAVVNGTLWSIDGYGLATPNYVEYYQGCPYCDLRGELQGHVYDADYNGGTECSIQPDSLSGSNVVFDPAAGGDTCYAASTPGTYCFEAESYTNDYEYRYSTWLKFPAGWNVSNAYVVGTPVCDSGASWGTFSWGYESGNLNEIQINHTAYQQTTDHCVATYCVDATPAGSGDALASWYWDGDGYNNVPHHPCSSDVYTPNSMSASPCDEAINPQAVVPDCGFVGGPTCTPATVTIMPGNIVVPVNPTTGLYGPVELIQGEYEVAADAGGYTSDVATVTIVDDETTVQDFELYRADIVLSDTAFDVASPYDVPLVETLTITNSGSLPLDWEILDFGAAKATAPVPTTFEVVPALAANKIDSDLAIELAGGPTDFFIWLAEKADLSGAYDLQTKEEKGQYVFDALTSVANRTQRELLAQLDQLGVAYQSFYIANKVLVLNGDPALAMEIAGRTDVYRLSANHQFQLDEPVVYDGSASPDAIETNLSYIFAPDVWALGFDGSGIVLAGNDTGLDETHSAIARHYRGCIDPPACTTWDHNYNWWDATGTYATNPSDGHGHGTHTTGTMVGDDGGTNQIGVAPGAQTVHCKNMTDGGSGDDGTFSECFQWDLAPWDLTGSNPMPSLAPDAINNSWGYGGGNQPQFEDEIAALHAAGILVEVSAGNEGSLCSSLRSPGDYEGVLTTGSVSHEAGAFPGPITGSSSRGPSALYPGEYFPDIMAPGNMIRSSLPGNSWGVWGGTSMAGPHATALIALMWDASPALRGNIDATIDIIHQTAEPLTGQMGSNCGGDYVTGPNNDWGFGTINALAAVQMAQQSADLPWVTESPITGTLPAGDVQDIDLTFLCTQEQAGEHLLGTLRVTSNDPCEESIDIPLAFYCQGVQDEPDIDINITDPLDVEQCPDDTTTVNFEICNIGTEDLTWEITETLAAPPLAVYGPPTPTTRTVELSLSGSGGGSVETNAPIVEAPVQLILDDGSRDNDIGLGGTIEMLWVNRFTPDPADFPFALNQVQIYFSSLGLVNVGDDIVIVVYENTTGGTDPAVGSNLLATFPATILALDAWNVYDITPVTFNGPGDVIIGAIGMETPGTSYWPASMDQTASQARSWAGAWLASPPPNPPTLPPDDLWTLIDAYFPGNWMVRGYGETAEPGEVPWLSEAPTEGVLAADECVTVAVTFDSTGMLPGDYAALLNVESNDPQTPSIELPVTMTVWEPLSDVDFDWMPAAPVLDEPVDFTATATGEEPIDYAWDFGDGGTATGATATHTFTTAGDHEVTLVVTNYCSVVTVEYTVTVMDAPDIVVDPLELASIQGPNTTVTLPLEIGNVGESDLIWDVMEATAPPLGAPVANLPVAGTDSAPASRHTTGPLALGDWLYDIDVEGITGGDNLILGVTFAFDSFWVTSGSFNLYEISPAGTLLNTYSQPSGCTSGWGGRDITADGAYLYFGCDDGLIHQIDPATGAQVGTFSSPLTPARALAYDPATDHFWTANWDSNIYEFTRAGAVVNTFAPVGLSTYGFAWDTWSPGGPFLWAWSQDGPDPLLTASQIDPATGTLTGVTFLGTGAAGEMAGGAELSDAVIDGQLVFLGMNQGVPDRIGVYDMDVTLGCQPGDFPWLSVDPATGTTAPDGTSIVEVTFDSTGLAVGEYDGYLCVNSNDPDEPQVPVTVTLTVAEGPAIVVDPLLLEMTLDQGETGIFTFTIENVGTEDLTFALAESIPWLSLSEISGTLAAGEALDVVATFDATGLEPADYTMDITITSNDPGHPSIAVTALLHVLDAYAFDLYLPIVNREFTP